MLWSDLKVKTDLHPTFMIFFMIRRFALASIIVCLLLLSDIFSVHFQCVLTSLTSLTLCLYIARSRPFQLPKLNSIELFNELCTLLVTIQIITMLNFSSYEQLSTQGLLVNYTLVAMFAVNVLFVFLGMAYGWL